MKAGKSLMLWCVVIGLGLGLLWSGSFAQDETRVGDDESGRLPVGYSAVVMKSQRREIYAIQDKYQRQIDELSKQISELEKRRDGEIAGMLTTEQKQALAIILKLREQEKAAEDPKAKAATAEKAAGSN